MYFFKEMNLGVDGGKNVELELKDYFANTSGQVF